MKKIILSLCLMIGIAHFGISQVGIDKEKLNMVGINTDNPKAQLHIDASKNNGPLTIPINTADDIVFTTDKNAPYYGHLGLGKITPDVGLDVNGNIRLEDGSEALNRMLVSEDNLGNAKWSSLPFSLVKIGKINDNRVSIGNVASDLTLEPLLLTQGKWLVISKFVIERITGVERPTQNVWIYLKNVTTVPDINNRTYNTIVGTALEQAGSYTGTPQLTTLVDVPKGQTHEFRIFGSTSNTGMATSPNFQGSLFYAVRLDSDILDN